MVDYLYQNLRLFSDRDSDPAMAEGRKAVAYYDYDVYMGITDYNSLHMGLNFAGFKTEGFAQNGHNGTDFL